MIIYFFYHYFLGFIIIKDLNGNNKIYARGINNKNQCGIVTDIEGEPIKHLTMCDYVKNLSF